MSGVFEPTAYCDPAEPFNEVAFAWPGKDREARHTDPLYSQGTVETLRAQLEAAERLVVAVEVQAEENFQRAEAAEAEAGRYRLAGQLLSNIAFNLAQVPGLSENTRFSLDDARKRWDAAIDAAMPRTKEEAK